MRAYVDIVYIMCVWYAVKYMRYMYIYMKSKIPYIHVYVMSAKKLQDLNHERRKWNDSLPICEMFGNRNFRFYF